MYTAVDDLFECPSTDDIVVTGTPFELAARRLIHRQPSKQGVVRAI
jgi:hypothetical protein